MAKVGLAASLLQSPVPCLCGRSYANGKPTSRPGFIAAGAGGLHPIPAAAASASASASASAPARQWASKPRVDSTRQKHATTTTRSSTRSDHDDIAPPAATSDPGVDVSAEPRPTVDGGAVVGGEAGLGGGGSLDSEVGSLVDLVKLLHTSDNPLWELVRFEVRGDRQDSIVYSAAHTCTTGSLCTDTHKQD